MTNETNMFVRINTEEEVQKTLAMLKREFGAEPKEGDELRRVYAPDGDVVFMAMPTSGGTFICRFHKEVFKQ